MRAIVLCVILTGCATEAASEPASAPSSPRQPAAAAKEPAAGTAEVGPDGPTHLAVAAYALSTDPAVITAGEQVFAAKGCGGCHAFGSKLVGPDLVGVTERRSLPWIGRMIMHPAEMIKEDPVAKDLFRTHMTPMPDQGVADADLEALVSYIASKQGS